VVIDRLRKNLDALNVVGSATGTKLEYEGTADNNLALGELVYASGAGTLDLAVASAVSTGQAIGVVTEAATAGNTAKVQTSGIVEYSGWSLTPNVMYYLDPSTGGAMTTTQPSTPTEVVLFVGTAYSATQLRLLLSPMVLL
jgi:hypothetical protein